MSKIIGIGGIFLKFENPKEMNLWYKDVLEMNVNDYGVLFAYNSTSNKRAFLQLGTFENTSDYFGKTDQKVMLNFRVDNLLEFKLKLEKKGVKIVDEIETYEYGKFLHIQDPEGNRIELWEAVDNEFEKSESFVDMQ